MPVRFKWIVISATSVLLLLALFSHLKAAEPSFVVQKLPPEQLNTLRKQENFFFLDVRSPQEIRELGTLPGYVNIPIDQLEQRLAELPKDKTLVTA